MYSAVGLAPYARCLFRFLFFFYIFLWGGEGLGGGGLGDSLMHLVLSFVCLCIVELPRERRAHGTRPG